jgi:hypothetical protein
MNRSGGEFSSWNIVAEFIYERKEKLKNELDVVSDRGSGAAPSPDSGGQDPG